MKARALSAALFFATIACLISCKTAANEMTMRFKDSITFIASTDLTLRIYEDSVMTKEFVGRGYSVADSIVYRAQNSDHCTITIHGEVENLVFRKNIDDNYGKGYDYYQKPKTLIVFAQTISYLGNDKMTSLRYLRAMGDETGKQMQNLTVDKNENLEELWCSDTGLEELDVSKNKKLRTLYCANNRLSKLDITNNKSLENLVCFDNGMTSLDVSENRRLKFLSCDNPLKRLDITKNKDLEDLICRAELTSLDIRNNRELISLLICDNNLSKRELDNIIENLPMLEPNGGAISLWDNPGYESCNRQLLKKKGWWEGIRSR